MEKKLLKKSKFAVTLYVISGLLTLYTVYMLYSTITYLTNYFSQNGTSFMSNFGTAIGYILTQCLVYLVYAILVFAAAKIYNEVRKANPDNYLSEAESKAILRAKEAKKIAKAEKKAAKTSVKEAQATEEKAEATEELKEAEEAEVKEETASEEELEEECEK